MQYEREMQGLQRFKGSAGYEEDIKSAQAERDKATAALRLEYGLHFDSILNGMAKAAQAQPMTAPTQEQLATLEVLKMRERLSRERTAKGNELYGRLSGYPGRPARAGPKA